jgi:hypothetical protein
VAGMTWANVMQHPLPFIMGACGITLVLSIARLVVRLSRPHTGRHVAGHELPANAQSGWDLELHDFPAADEDQAAAGLPTLAQQAVWLPSYFTPPVRHDWREQTAADVAPEALDAACVLCQGCRGDDHCDGQVEGCDCTCGFDDDWAEEHADAEPVPPTALEVEEGTVELERHANGEQGERCADTGDWMSAEARLTINAELARQDDDRDEFMAWMRAEFAAAA